MKIGGPYNTGRPREEHVSLKPLRTTLGMT